MAVGRNQGDLCGISFGPPPGQPVRASLVVRRGMIALISLLHFPALCGLPRKRPGKYLVPFPWPHDSPADSKCHPRPGTNCRQVRDPPLRPEVYIDPFLLFGPGLDPRAGFL
jgi:hypothetical protein